MRPRSLQPRLRPTDAKAPPLRQGRLLPNKHVISVSNPAFLAMAATRAVRPFFHSCSEQSITSHTHHLLFLFCSRRTLFPCKMRLSQVPLYIRQVPPSDRASGSRSSCSFSAAPAQLSQCSRRFVTHCVTSFFASTVLGSICTHPIPPAFVYSAIPGRCPGPLQDV